MAPRGRTPTGEESICGGLEGSERSAPAQAYGRTPPRRPPRPQVLSQPLVSPQCGHAGMRSFELQPHTSRTLADLAANLSSDALPACNLCAICCELLLLFARYGTYEPGDSHYGAGAVRDALSTVPSNEEGGKAVARDSRGGFMRAPARVSPK